MLRRERLDLGEGAVGVAVELDEAADRVRAVLGLRRELELGDSWLGVAAREDDDLGRAGGKVDRDVSGDQQLGLVHVRIAGTDDLVDAGDRLGSVRKGGDGRRPADRPHLFESEQLGGGGDEPRAGRRRRHDDPIDACDLGGNGAHDERRDESARDVDPDGSQWNPAAPELDAGRDLEPRVRWTPERVPATNRVGERKHGICRQLAAGHGAGRLDPVEAQGPLAERAVSALAHVTHNFRNAH